MTWNASDYAQNSSQQEKWGLKLLDQLQLRGNESILDLGCGDGKITAAIAQRVPNGDVLGVDLSQSMIEFASRTHGAGNLRFEVADMSALSFVDRFDIVFSNAAMHWTRDHRPVLRGISNALKTGGRALLQMGGKGNAAEVLTAIERVTQREPFRQAFENFTSPFGFHGVEEYRAWLTEVGLFGRRVELIEKDMQHPGETGLLGWLRSAWPAFVNRVPPAQQSQFVEAIAREYLAVHPLDAHNVAHVRMIRLEVDAQK